MVEQVNVILILTNIAIAAAGAAVGDPCSGCLAFVPYRDGLRKRHQDKYISTLRTTHLSTISVVEIRGKSDDRLARVTVSTTAI